MIIVIFVNIFGIGLTRRTKNLIRSNGRKNVRDIKGMTNNKVELPEMTDDADIGALYFILDCADQYISENEEDSGMVLPGAVITKENLIKVKAFSVKLRACFNHLLEEDETSGI